MSWQKEIDELNKRKNLAQKLGGKEKIERQHKANRNTISENITVPTNTNCGSFGPLEITNGTTITISNGAAWSII